MSRRDVLLEMVEYLAVLASDEVLPKKRPDQATTAAVETVVSRHIQVNVAIRTKPAVGHTHPILDREILIRAHPESF
jgi:hypothetical protein